MRDKITALAAPPGHSLTGRPGKWAWERPARFSNPDDAIDYLTETISNGPNKTDMLKLMVAGITVEELVLSLRSRALWQGRTPGCCRDYKASDRCVSVRHGFRRRL